MPALYRPLRFPAPPHAPSCALTSPAWTYAGPSAPRSRSPGDTCKRSPPGASTTASGRLSPCPGPLAQRRRVRPIRRSAPVPPNVRPPAPATGAFVDLDGVFYYGDIWLDGGYLGRPRATSSRTPSRSPTAARPRASTARRRGRVPAAAGIAPRSARSPACSRTGTTLDPGVEPGRDLAAGAYRARPGPCASRGCACCAARPRPSAAGSDCDLDARRRHGPLRASCHASVRDPTARAARRVRGVTLAAGDNQLAWTSSVDHPPLWWPLALGDATALHVHDRWSRSGATSSDARELRTGVPRDSLRDWRCR